YWGYEWIQTGAALGIVTGTSVTTFLPNRPISRQEAATLLVRAIKGSPDPEPALSFMDMDRTDAWALPSVKKAIELGLMNGY
ncbi:S-layer homology domain-containing protein, partial [Frankia sp. Cpl3]|nr:S-layer homology domain-containing protein [Frankia sp. Cpl3]